jgi:hypothetical protein
VRLLPYLRQVVPAVRAELRGTANPELAVVAGAYDG